VVGHLSIRFSKLSRFPRAIWYSVVTIAGFTFTFLMLCLYVFHIVELFWERRECWLLVEASCYATLSLAYLSAGLVTVVWTSKDSLFGTAAVCALVVCLIYTGEAIYKTVAWQRDKTAQEDLRSKGSTFSDRKGGVPKLILTQRAVKSKLTERSASSDQTTTLQLLDDRSRP